MVSPAVSLPYHHPDQSTPMHPEPLLVYTRHQCRLSVAHDRFTTIRPLAHDQACSSSGFHRLFDNGVHRLPVLARIQHTNAMSLGDFLLIGHWRHTTQKLGRDPLSYATAQILIVSQRRRFMSNLWRATFTPSRHICENRI